MEVNKYKHIFWDFDGVILDSMKVRDMGFREIFKSYSDEKVQALINYHREQGGLSRYVKIRYFYEQILGKTITDEKVLEYANAFSEIMKQHLTQKENLIVETVQFIQKYHASVPMYIVSGSDQTELRFLCQELGIALYFKVIHGSPTPKKEWVVNIMEDFSISKNEACLIGDSINDFEAAEHGGLDFYGFNNQDLHQLGKGYIDSFKEL